MTFINFTISISKDQGWKEQDLHSMVMAFFDLQGIRVIVTSEVEEEQPEIPGI